MDVFIILDFPGLVIGYFCIVFVKFSMASRGFHAPPIFPVEKLWTPVQNTENYFTV